MKIHEAVKKIKRLAPPENLLSKQKMDLPEMKKAVRDHRKIFQKKLLYKCSANAELLPTLMLTYFTSSEIRETVSTLKNNKNPT